MSKIEAAAKPFALSLMLGGSIALAPETQRKLALWAYSSARSSKLTLQIIRSYLGHRVLEVNRDPRVAGRDRRIWPATGMFTWPLGDALSDAELAIYTRPRVKGAATGGLIYPM
jgi:hypothetical protein